MGAARVPWSVHQETKDMLLLVGKSILLALGGLVAVAAVVDIRVDGPGRRNLVALVVGLSMAVPPLALAFRDAVRHGKRG